MKGYFRKFAAMKQAVRENICLQFTPPLLKSHNAGAIRYASTSTYHRPWYSLESSSKSTVTSCPTLTGEVSSSSFQIQNARRLGLAADSSTTHILLRHCLPGSRCETPDSVLPSTVTFPLNCIVFLSVFGWGGRP